MVYFFDSYFLMALPSTPALSKKLGRENFVLSCLVLSCLVLSAAFPFQPTFLLSQTAP